MSGYSKTYTLDFTASGDTVYNGCDKLEDNVDDVIGWLNNVKKSYASSSAPSSPTPDEGQLWYDSTNNQLNSYNGSSWSTHTTESAVEAQLIPASVKILFYADTAPTGYTIDATLNDKVVFITKGSAASGQTGGGAHSTGTWTVAGLTMAAHNHKWLHNSGAGAADQSYNEAGTQGELPEGSKKSGAYDHIAISYLTSDWPLSEAWTNKQTPALSSAGTWRPAAYCFIVCAKDAYSW